MLTLFFLILKFICCQFAACLFYGISLIKYFLFSPLSPWLLTLLPTLTIVCCGKFLLVEFFFPFSAPFPPTSPFCCFFFCFVLHCGTPNFILTKSYANSSTPLMAQQVWCCQLQALQCPESGTKAFLSSP